VISCNTPLNPQLSLMKATHRSGAAFVFWVQDLLGYGIRRILGNRWGRAGELAGRYFEHLEKQIGRHSDAIVLITRDFMPYVTPWAAAEDKFSIIQNWAEIEQMPVCPEENAWKTAAGLAGRTCFTYTGTMGLKHNAEHLVHLARHFSTRPDVAIVVVSEGLGADWLRAKKAELGLDNLHLLGFQPYDQMPMVLGASSALIATLEEDAGIFAVPSKVLNYLCAGRPILLAVPSGNLSARLVAEAGAGYGYPPGDVEGFVAAADQIAADPDLRRKLGENGRRYAETNFTPEIVLRQFASVINTVRPRTHKAVSEESALARS
jgi:colanic acid biosynthesis glycosyl transferase WcaI